MSPGVPNVEARHEVGSLGMKQWGLRSVVRYLAVILAYSLGGIPRCSGKLGIRLQRVWAEAPDSFANPEERRERHGLI